MIHGQKMTPEIKLFIYCFRNEFGFIDRKGEIRPRIRIYKLLFSNHDSHQIWEMLLTSFSNSIGVEEESIRREVREGERVRTGEENNRTEKGKV